MTKKQILISTPSIQLNQLLKLAGVVGSGGEAKMLIRDEQVKVDGEVVGYEQVGTGTFRTVNLMDTEESSSYTRKVLDQAVTQNLVTRDIADEALKDLKNGNVKIAVEKIFPPPPPTSD